MTDSGKATMAAPAPRAASSAYSMRRKFPSRSPSMLRIWQMATWTLRGAAIETLDIASKISMYAKSMRQFSPAVEPAHNGRMTTLTGEQAKLILNTIGLPALKAEHPVTARVIAAIPSHMIDYRPDDIVKSAIDLAWHIVSAENRFLEAVINGTFDLSPVPRPDSIRTADAVNDWYTPRFEKNLERLAALTGDQLTKSVDFRGLLQFPAVRYVPLALNHSIHHRGQLTMYLRPMGAKVPSIYGESYDARTAREAAAAQR
jgi:uncharacterized damage-inducible protein DinB